METKLLTENCENAKHSSQEADDYCYSNNNELNENKIINDMLTENTSEEKGKDEKKEYRQECQEQLEEQASILNCNSGSNEEQGEGEQGINIELTTPAIKEIVELTPELTLANVPLFDRRVELPNAASIGGHHLSLTEGRIFMKQSCSAREKRFYELIKNYQQELVERAASNASSIIHRYLQKGIPDALEQSFNMYIEREKRQQEHPEQSREMTSSEKLGNVFNAKVKNNSDSNVERVQEEITNNVVIAHSDTDTNNCYADNNIKMTIPSLEVIQKSDNKLNSEVKEKMTYLSIPKDDVKKKTNYTPIEINSKDDSGASLINGSFNSVSLFNNSTFVESEDNVTGKENNKENVEGVLEMEESAKERRQKRLAASLWWTVMAHEYHNNEENRNEIFSDMIGSRSSNDNNNVEVVKTVNDTPTNTNVRWTVKGKRNITFYSSSSEFNQAECPMSTDTLDQEENILNATTNATTVTATSAANTTTDNKHNNSNNFNDSVTSSFIRTWQQNNVIDDGHYETTYEVQRQVMNNSSFASNITNNTNASGKIACFRSPTSARFHVMRSPSMNSQRGAMCEVQNANEGLADTLCGSSKGSPLQESDMDVLSTNHNSTANTHHRSDEDNCLDNNNNNINITNSNTKDTICNKEAVDKNHNLSCDELVEREKTEGKAIGDSRCSNAAQDDCASVITAYSSVSTRATAMEVEKARALHWLAPFIPRYFGVRKVRLSTITQLGVPRVCLNGWSVDEKDIINDEMQTENTEIEGEPHRGEAVKAENCSSLEVKQRTDNDNKYYPNKNSNNSKSGEMAQTLLEEVATVKEKKIRRSSTSSSAKRKKTPLRFQFSLSSLSHRQKNEHGFPGVNNEVNYVEPYCKMIAMEDVCYHFVHPCVLDMKMGSRQYGLHPTATKKKSKEKKALQSTSAKYGIRLAGYRRWNEQTQTYVKRSKLECRSLTLAELKNELYTFLQQNRQMEHMFRKQVENLRIVFSKQTVFRFYTSSLLFVYDADDPLKTGRIVMVDFAYTYEKDELIQDNDPEASFAYDVGYLKALDTLLSLLA